MSLRYERFTLVDTQKEGSVCVYGRKIQNTNSNDDEEHNKKEEAEKLCLKNYSSSSVHNKTSREKGRCFVQLKYYFHVHRVYTGTKVYNNIKEQNHTHLKC